MRQVRNCKLLGDGLMSRRSISRRSKVAGSNVWQANVPRSNGGGQVSCSAKWRLPEHEHVSWAYSDADRPTSISLIRSSHHVVSCTYGHVSYTVLNFDRSTVKHARQNIQYDCHHWLYHSFRVHQIRFRQRSPDPQTACLL